MAGGPAREALAPTERATYPYGMIDPGILVSLDAQMPPALPAMVVERQWRTDAGDSAEKLGQKYVRAYDEHAISWIANLSAFKAKIEAADITGFATAEQIQQLGRIIEQYELIAETRAKMSARLKKSAGRQARAAFRTDPSIAAAYRQTAQQLLAIDRRIEEELLDYALFLRAIRTKADPRSRGGPTYDNLDDLSRHLDDLAAA
ncbi:hypothetical protein H0176_23460 [Methylorubrum populi]|uniref:hypothetical protein n=1 Tax=Methylorubrum rhodesianum TaxID=29427 RepID=UPI00190D484A|nr:hypothetical protein [Methylorubrum rhodesianum]MBK3406304.1 hypothetical protein [Methylorubrum rhodesianum]MBY0143202.1 hypothetical protein [Methylorubrum populi]